MSPTKQPDGTPKVMTVGQFFTAYIPLFTVVIMLIFTVVDRRDGAVREEVERNERSLLVQASVADLKREVAEMKKQMDVIYRWAYYGKNGIKDQTGQAERDR